MANVKVVNPDITVLEYNQEKTDKDYGSCLWAKFYFDTTNCKLLITLIVVTMLMAGVLIPSRF